MAYKNMGQYNGGIIKSRATGTVPQGAVRTTDASITSGLTFLTGELEKVDSKIRQPLNTLTYARDLPIKTGGGWVETLSAMGIEYGMQGGGQEQSIITGGGVNEIPVIQADMSKEIFKTHAFAAVMRVFWVDVQRSKITGRSLEQMAIDGIRAAYDKHMERNAYLGFPNYDTYGLFNQPTVKVQKVADGAAGSGKKKWTEKTPDEILKDINTAIAECWANAAYDRDAIPNHILIPYEQLIYISTTRMSDIAEGTILDFLLKHNTAKANGVDLVIAATSFAKGAGVGNTDRMVVYVNDDRFIAMEELVSLNRSMTQTKTDTLSYDSVYTANISEVEVFYDQPICYYDGI